MRRRLTATRSDEQGFTLVEMMISILILAIILTAMASVLITSLTSMQREEQRVRATQLAQEELERIRAIEWDCAAFDPSAAGYTTPDPVSGNATVALDAECSDPTIAPDPQPFVRGVDGIDYTVALAVYWIDDDVDGTAATGDADPHDYKEFRADVSWNIRGDAFSHSDSSTRVPTVEEVPPDAVAGPATFAITAFNIDPAIVEISAGNVTQAAATMRVETSLQATGVAVTSVAYNQPILTDVSGNGTVWEAQIPNGTFVGAAGTYDFTATATAVSGTDTETTRATFAQNLGTAVAVTSTTLAPSSTICVANNSKSHLNVIVTTTVDGLSLLDDVDISWTNNSETAAAVPVALTATGATYRSVIPLGTRFTGSTTTLSVNAVRLADNAEAQRTYTVPIATFNNVLSCP